jgi:hypothetical protein
MITPNSGHPSLGTQNHPKKPKFTKNPKQLGTNTLSNRQNLGT